MSARARGGAAPLYWPLPGWRDPIETLRLFATEPMPALLHSGRVARAPRAGPAARWSILCARPVEVISWRVGHGGDPFQMLERALSRHAEAGGWRAGAAEGSGALAALPFLGGAVGYAGYEAGCSLLAHPGGAARSLTPAADAGLPPDLMFGIYPWAILWDHRRRAWGIVSTGLSESGPGRPSRARADAEMVRARLEGGPGRATRASRSRGCFTARGRRAAPRPQPAPIVSSSLSRAAYHAMVQEARGLIERGELYQVNLSQRLELAAPADPLDLFEAVARHSAAPFSAYLDLDGFQIVSASPERFVSLRNGVAESRPIKGTRPRGRTLPQDRALARELVGSAKDRAENVMIVDLVRNDLGRVCVTGSVEATAICRLETYASVHHLVSSVSGRLAQGRTRADLLAALSPGGSMTGAPKVRAVQAIADLEPVGRGPYAGGLGYLSLCGAMDLSMIIRTAVVAGGRTWLHVGGGVVADSDPELEYEETLHKAESVRRALGACRKIGALGRRSGVNLPAV